MIQALRYILLLIVLLYILNQVRKPTRWIGRLFALAMNASHSRLTDWGLKHVTIEKDFTILDVGCGGGRTIQKLAAIAVEGLVCGIDFAKGSIAVSSKKNAKLISAGRVEIRQASVSQLPFLNDHFDLATAVETLYYWPNPVQDMKEILRVLKPGGTLIVIAESYKGGKYDKLEAPVMWLLRSTPLSPTEYRDLFSAAEFTSVQILENRDKGWICVKGKKAI